MQPHTAQFVTSATSPDHYPPGDLPEIAFVGRSNVGKSTLMNAVMNRKSLVKTSSTPGRTQLINFFLVDGSFRLVDLPGYGFARVPEAVRRSWGPMIESYLSMRGCLAGVVLILDVRRLPSPDDLRMMEWLCSFRRKSLIVVTKCDKVSRNERGRQLSLIAQELGVDHSRLFPFSSPKREGVERIREEIGRLVSEWLREEP